VTKQNYYTLVENNFSDVFYFCSIVRLLFKRVSCPSIWAYRINHPVPSIFVFFAF